ncbi:MAG: hypothetical protein EA392_08385 [Cryomorphaceae bacterium]|nr:MAG: hypothetical protein EA392_08385 [Cryomorphaceae bacterium]
MSKSALRKKERNIKAENFNRTQHQFNAQNLIFTTFFHSPHQAPKRFMMKPSFLSAECKEHVNRLKILLTRLKFGFRPKCRMTKAEEG